MTVVVTQTALIQHQQAIAWRGKAAKETVQKMSHQENFINFCKTPTIFNLPTLPIDPGGVVKKSWYSTFWWALRILRLNKKKKKKKKKTTKNLRTTMSTGTSQASSKSRTPSHVFMFTTWWKNWWHMKDESGVRKLRSIFVFLPKKQGFAVLKIAWKRMKFAPLACYRHPVQAITAQSFRMVMPSIE